MELGCRRFALLALEPSYTSDGRRHRLRFGPFVRGRCLRRVERWRGARGRGWLDGRRRRARAGRRRCGRRRRRTEWSRWFVRCGRFVGRRRLVGRRWLVGRWRQRRIGWAKRCVGIGGLGWSGRARGSRGCGRTRDGRHGGCWCGRRGGTRHGRRGPSTLQHGLVVFRLRRMLQRSASGGASRLSRCRLRVRLLRLLHGLLGNRLRHQYVQAQWRVPHVRDPSSRHAWLQQPVRQLCGRPHLCAVRRVHHDVPLALIVRRRTRR